MSEFDWSDLYDEIPGAREHSAKSIVFVAGASAMSCARVLEGPPPRSAEPVGFALLSAVTLPRSKLPKILLSEFGSAVLVSPSPLKALSRYGSAAGVYWDDEGLIILGCARKAAVVWFDEFRGWSDELPVASRPPTRHDSAGDGDLLLALDIAASFTRLEVQRLDPSDFGPWERLPISIGVNDLPASSDELTGLGYPSPRIVALAASTTETARRRLAFWAVRAAYHEAGMQSNVAARTLIESWSGERPCRITVGMLTLRVESEREPIIDPGGATNYDLSEEDEAMVSRWARTLWAVRSFFYAAEKDSLTAALGTTYCLIKLAEFLPSNADEFLRTAEQVLEPGR